MINVLPTQNTSFRAFGWVQDPSNMRSLCDVVAIFDETSGKHQELRNGILPRLVEERDGREQLIEALDTRPLKIRYLSLVGTSFTPRSASRCNGLVQAAVKGQVRPFIGDWPADNFVRWAHAFGFIRYDYRDDAFEITPSGRALVSARTSGDELSENETELLVTAILAYPPAVRVLNLLSETEAAHLTKFELGRRLGFVGEDGFTNLPQAILIKALKSAESAKERNSMKADWDGSSDKYARMISKWLEKLGLVEQVSKKVTVSSAGREYTETIGQAYMITAAGISALNRTVGKSRYKRIPKNVCFEMLATKGGDREYLRTRRAFILKAIAERKGPVTLSELRDYLAENKLTERIETIGDDVQGLISIGLNIAFDGDRCVWNDEINDFTLPLPQSLARSELSALKEELRAKLKHLSHEYMSLVDLAYDGGQNRLFEMKTLELLTEECKFSGLHLGGSRKPDGLIYTTGLSRDYGIIIDTKAYSGGYSLPISQADEMERYIRENQTRDKDVNPNEWWLKFGGNIKEYYYAFISGHFTGNIAAQLDRISRNTGVEGAALNVCELLLSADELKGGSMTQEAFRDTVFKRA
jgi:hypothetical protein